MKQIHYKRLTILVSVALLVLSSATVAPVAANHDPGPLDEIINGHEEASSENESFIEQARSFGAETYSWARGTAGGLYKRAGYERKQLSPWTGGPDLDAEANATVDLVNNNSAVITDYVNNKTTTSNYDASEYNVHEVTLVNEDHDIEETFYIVGTYNESADEWDSFNATRQYDGEVDQEHRLSGFLAESTSEEAEYYLENYVQMGERPSGEYLGRMSAKYGGIFGQQAESTMLDDGFNGSD
jgi:hypothetical protein